jgi:hypothetical protein
LVCKEAAESLLRLETFLLISQEVPAEAADQGSEHHLLRVFARAEKVGKLLIHLLQEVVLARLTASLQ